MVYSVGCDNNLRRRRCLSRLCLGARLYNVDVSGQQFICGPDTSGLFYICADNSGHLHHVDRLAFLHVCKVSELA